MTAYLAVGSMVLQHYRRRPVDVSYVGKAATASLMFGFCDLLLGLPQVAGIGLVDVAWLPGLNSQPAALGILFVYLGVALSATAAVIYTVEGMRLRRQAIEERGAGNGK